MLSKKKILDFARVLLVLCRFIWLGSNGLELGNLLATCRFLRLLGLTSCSSTVLISPIPDEHVEDTGVNGSTSKGSSLAALTLLVECFSNSSTLRFHYTENKT
jgi:hypothetical protein